MNILDENVLGSQRQLLHKWRVPFIRFLLTLSRSTFFTQDQDYYKQGLCHARYCLVVVDVRRTECAAFIRRVLRHPELDTQAKRMGNVIRASHRRLAVWRLHTEKEVYLDWTD